MSDYYLDAQAAWDIMGSQELVMNSLVAQIQRIEKLEAVKK